MSPYSLYAHLVISIFSPTPFLEFAAITPGELRNNAVDKIHISLNSGLPQDIPDTKKPTSKEIVNQMMVVVDRFS